MVKNIYIGSLILCLFILTACSGMAVQPTGAVLVGLGQSSGRFTRADGPIQFRFPADFGAHPGYQTEWWYYTGNLETSSGRHFGYQLTFFRRALVGQDEIQPRVSDWGASQVYLANFALTDVDGRQYQAFERFSRGAVGLAGATGEPSFRVWLDDWQVNQNGPAEYHLFAEENGITLDLILDDLKGPVLQGGDGYSQKGPDSGNASYYFSQTRLASSGTVRLNGMDFAVTGNSWMDHEYSTSALSPDQIGWDWFALQLDDGSELMVFDIRRVDGSIDLFSSGTWIAPDGQVTHLPKADFSIVSSGAWRSPHSGASYPDRWEILVPSLGLQMQISPLLSDQEVHLTFTYWEGAVKIAGMRGGQTVSGYGYVEMTGYAGSMAGQF